MALRRHFWIGAVAVVTALGVVGCGGGTANETPPVPDGSASSDAGMSGNGDGAAPGTDSSTGGNDSGSVQTDDGGASSDDGGASSDDGGVGSDGGGTVNDGGGVGATDGATDGGSGNEGGVVTTDASTPHDAGDAAAGDAGVTDAAENDSSTAHDASGDGAPGDATVPDATVPDSGNGSDSTTGDAAGTGDATLGDSGPTLQVVGVTVTGLAGTGLALQDNLTNNLGISGNGTFDFTTAIATGDAYSVTVLSQPTSPTQVCTVTGGSGTASASGIPGVTVNCVTQTYTITAKVSGLAGSGLVLQDNGADNLSITGNGSFTFATPVASGAPFNVRVSTQPSSPTQSCSVGGATGTVAGANVTSVSINCSTDYSIGGTILGLVGSVVLQDNNGDDLTVSSNGSFAFPTPLATAATYSVTVETQPTGPSQTCVVISGSGTVATSDVSGVFVSCTTDAYTVGGSISGLSGSVILQDNLSDNVTVTAGSTSFTFAQAVASGGAYSVSVLVQPSSPAQTCTVTTNTASGTVTTGNVISVAVTCTTSTFTIGGSVSGLTGSGLVLQDNGGDSLPVSGSAFTFATPVASGAAFAVSILTQPSSPAQTCTVSGGGGTVGSSDVNGVVINCSTSTFTVGGMITGLSGSVVLKNNDNSDTLTVTTGSFAFPTPVASGAAYSISVLTQPSSPSQTCTITGSSGSGTVLSANVNSVTLTCSTNTYTVGGAVTGLASGATLVLSNGSDTTTVNGTGSNVGFTMPTSVASGAGYGIGVQTQPSVPSQTCAVTNNGSGTVGGANVTNVAVTCTTNTYTVGGNVTGLSSLGLVLQDNNGDNLSVGANGTFTFATKVASGSTYTVSIFAQPTSPAQTCMISGGATGPVTSANINAVQISCQTNTYTVGGSVSGLAGTLVLQNNGGSNLNVTSSSFAFPAAASGSLYDVTILSQPSSPSQTCTINSGAIGVIGSANVIGVSISCTTNTYTIGGTLSNFSGTTPLVLYDNGGDPLTLSTNGSFVFATPVASGASYAVTIHSGPSSGVTCTVAPSTSGGTVGGANVINVAVTCSAAPSCLSILTSTPGAASGTYTIDPDGSSGSIVPFLAYCDMTFDDGNGHVGGWTLIEATSGGLGPSGLTPGLVSTGSGTYMPSATMQVLANLSAQVHVRTPGAASTQSITSVAGGSAITNIQQLKITDQLSDPGPEHTNWTGPYADSTHLDFSCDTSGNSYPSIFWACGNGNGTHLITVNSRWNWDGGDTTQNINMEAYLR